MTRWTTTDIPPQAGRHAIVTGTGGIGFETARALALAGATVILAGRSPSKGRDAIARLRTEVPASRVRHEVLDLACLSSVAAFAYRMRSDLDRVDILVNNAGVMTPPDRRLTTDGFELQLGTNHLGHFALTARLMPLLRAGAASRVVSVSSVAARSGSIDFDDLNARRSYRPMPI